MGLSPACLTPVFLSGRDVCLAAPPPLPGQSSVRAKMRLGEESGVGMAGGGIMYSWVVGLCQVDWKLWGQHRWLLWSVEEREGTWGEGRAVWAWAPAVGNCEGFGGQSRDWPGAPWLPLDPSSSSTSCPRPSGIPTEAAAQVLWVGGCPEPLGSWQSGLSLSPGPGTSFPR